MQGQQNVEKKKKNIRSCGDCYVPNYYWTVTFFPQAFRRSYTYTYRAYVNSLEMDFLNVKVVCQIFRHKMTRL